MFGQYKCARLDQACPILQLCVSCFHVSVPPPDPFHNHLSPFCSALDVILVTKEGTSSLHGLDDTDGVGDDEQTSPLPGGLRGPSAMSTDEDKSEHESDEEDDDSSDSEGEDNDTHVVGDKGGAGVSSSSVGALAAGGDRLDRMETTRAHKKRLYDWQVEGLELRSDMCIYVCVCLTQTKLAPPVASVACCGHVCECAAWRLASMSNHGACTQACKQRYHVGLSHTPVRYSIVSLCWLYTG